jgi:hypothetical protein
MPCRTMYDENGEPWGIACSRGRREIPKCVVCGNPSTSLCDYPLGGGRICDAPLCRDCRAHVGMDTDHCPKHNTPEAISRIFNGGAK